MEIVEIFVEYPSGMTITDRASFSRDADQVYPSERLQAVLREFSITEAPPAVSAAIDGVNVQLDARTDGNFSVGVPIVVPNDESTGDRKPVRLGKAWSKDQRQQFGRFCHALTVASLAGFVGYWHSTSSWTAAAILNEAALAAIIVLTFIVGMDSMNGE
ncbi:hypothetical protein QYH69_22160 [Paraburkholderia sp. SARCC-3016]|uniref:hypothetical protein n=1 Tax=Paraburkholderia sp. SARCC-3016 TaxID=3058611 RepID=UPI0028096C51|nr:hypothetical protein [Paraburkholderia sp. SARCC-3016]MDQ7979949.1 hypothetical protein [Paraburkholderia sp. SARCC-3016]